MKWKRIKQGGTFKFRKKYIVILAAAAAVIGGCAFGGAKIYQHFHGGVVNVYAVSQLGESAEWMEDDSTMSGSVSTDQLQTEYVSESQTVSEIYVTKGQKVKVGDKLFSYDSTLDELDLKRSKINLQRKQMELEQAQKELAVIQTYRAGVPIPESGSSSSSSSSSTSSQSSSQSASQSTSSEAEVPTYAGLKLLGGEGTKDNPYQYKWSEKFQFTKAFLAAAAQGKNEAYVLFLLDGDEVSGSTKTEQESNGSTTEDTTGTTEEADSTVAVDDPTDEEDEEEDDQEEQEGTAQGSDNDSVSTDQITKPAGQYSASWTMQLQKSGSRYRYRMLSMTVGGVERTLAEPMTALAEDTDDPDDSDDSDGSDDSDDSSGTVYTQTEINQMLTEQKQSIKDLELEIRQAKIEYQKQEQELENSVVYSKVNGTVTKLRTPQKAGTTKPLIKIAGSEAGYSIRGVVHELERDTVQKGQSVVVTNEDTGETYDGVVESVSRYPVADSSWYYDYSSNPNASYYPFWVKVTGKADFTTDSYITLSLGSTGETGDSFYLLNAFVRSENGQSYIYVAGEDGTLEKRIVTTGKSMWGSYTEIKNGGISEDEYIAFPYGKNVHEGAETQEASTDDLYSY